MRYFINSIGWISISLIIASCNGGSGGSGDNGGSGGSISPNPAPNATLYESPPIFATPPMCGNSNLRIANGCIGDDAVFENLVAKVTIYSGGTYICSATPVDVDANGNTWLVTAAHCVKTKKEDFYNVNSTEIAPPNSLTVGNGPYGDNSILNIQHVYVPNNYCYGSKFSAIGGCPNFDPSAGVGTQGNDIAVILAQGTLGNPSLYPKIVRHGTYPRAYTMAPILSMGYGNTENTASGNGTLYYASNYYYLAYDEPGYHYLKNSYFSARANGYLSVICPGDSGGGDLFWNGTEWILLSSHTYGPTGVCGATFNYLPNGATNVGYYYDWIRNIINNPNGGCTLANNCVMR